jgi:hypothetical protein
MCLIKCAFVGKKNFERYQNARYNNRNFKKFHLKFYFLIVIDRSLDVLQLPYFFRRSKQIILNAQTVDQFCDFSPGNFRYNCLLEDYYMLYLLLHLARFLISLYRFIILCYQYRLSLAAVIPPLLWGYWASAFYTMCERQEEKYGICQIK